jgi:hypothetical protein
MASLRYRLGKISEQKFWSTRLPGPHDLKRGESRADGLEIPTGVTVKAQGGLILIMEVGGGTVARASCQRALPLHTDPRLFG